MEHFLPHGVQVPEDGLGPLLGFAHLHCDVGVAGAGAVFSLQTLSTQYCTHTHHGLDKSPAQQLVLSVRTGFKT